MLWNWYTLDACFLTRSWHITTHAGFAATCLGTVALVVAVEALRRVGKEYDAHLRRGFAARVARIAGDSDALDAERASDGAGLDGAAAHLVGDGGVQVCSGGGRARRGHVVTMRASPVEQLVRAVIHAATFGLAYVVMLLAMYYNGYILICIVLGALLGKFLCDWMAVTVVVGGGEGAVVKGNGGGLGGVIEEPTVCCG